MLLYYSLSPKLRVHVTFTYFYGYTSFSLINVKNKTSLLLSVVVRLIMSHKVNWTFKLQHPKEDYMTLNLGRGTITFVVLFLFHFVLVWKTWVVSPPFFSFSLLNLVFKTKMENDLVGGSSPATLPLPLAAFVSLTITYKVDRASQRFLNLAGPALESLAAGCPWPCMPIVASLWTQKAKRWSDFLVFSASRTVFLHDNDAVVQLLKSCFTSTLGLKTTPLSSNGGVGALLGHGFGSHFYGELSPVAPGILYLRVYRSIRDIMFLREEIVYLLIQSVGDIVRSGLPKENLEKLKRAKNGMRCGQVSLATAMTQVKLAASLGASLAWLSGGLGLVQSLIKETLPSWFLSVHRSEHEEGGPGGAVAMLVGYALAYFTVLCGAFAWGVDSSLSASRRRPKVLGYHMEFLASALDGKISLGCDGTTWRAYVTGFMSLMVGCTPGWVMDVEVEVLKRMSKGLLRQWGEEELALALLGVGGVGTMGAAAELIIESEL